MSDLRARILGARDIQSERVTIPAWDNVELEVRGMSLRQRGQISERLSDADGKVDAAKLAAAVLIEACFDPTTGARVFQEADRDALMDKSASAVDRVTKVALRLSGLGEDDGKNDSGASGSGITASPETSA